MLDDLAAATRAFEEAQAAVEEALAGVAEARAQVPVARARLAEEIVKAARAGARQKDIVAVTKYNRESVRRILRANGIEPE